MSGPRVSVVVPMYNAAATVAGSLGSLQSQGLTDWEALVFDDGSTDASAEIVRTISKADPRVRLIQQPNRGASAARNAATLEARGEYLYWLDPDDLCLPDALSLLVGAAESNGLGAAVGHHDVVNTLGELLHGYRLGPTELGLNELLDGCSTRCGSHVVRRDLVMGSLGKPILWDESLTLWEDRDYWLRLAEHGVRWGVIDRVVTSYVIQPLGGAGKTSLSKRADEMLHSGVGVLRGVFDRHAGEPGFEADRLRGLLGHNGLHSASRAAAISGDGAEAAKALVSVTGRMDWDDRQLVDAARFGVMYGRGIVPSEASADPAWVCGLDSLWAAIGRDPAHREAIWQRFVRAVVTPDRLARESLDQLNADGSARGLVVVGCGQQGRAIVVEALQRGFSARVRDDAGPVRGLPTGVAAEAVDAPIPEGWRVVVSPLSPGTLRSRMAGCGALFVADVLEGLVRGSSWDPAEVARRALGGIVGHPAPC
ncbi:MAG: hypothetical protein ACI89L_002087 [Phycisphaerales bacterium]|jgi:hypothetical protein